MFEWNTVSSIYFPLSFLQFTTGKDKITKNSILARNFNLWQGNKDKSCTGQEIRETRTRFHPCDGLYRKMLVGVVVIYWFGSRFVWIAWPLLKSLQNYRIRLSGASWEKPAKHWPNWSWWGEIRWSKNSHILPTPCVSPPRHGCPWHPLCLQDLPSPAWNGHHSWAWLLCACVHGEGREWWQCCSCFCWACF